MIFVSVSFVHSFFPPTHDSHSFPSLIRSAAICGCFGIEALLGESMAPKAMDGMNGAIVSDSNWEKNRAFNKTIHCDFRSTRFASKRHRRRLFLLLSFSLFCFLPLSSVLIFTIHSHYSPKRLLSFILFYFLIYRLCFGIRIHTHTHTWRLA